MLGIFVKGLRTDSLIGNAQVVLQRPTRLEEQQTDSFGAARFQVDPEREQSLRIKIRAGGYQHRSQVIDTPKQDGSYVVYLDPDLEFLDS
jgi:hypothetical protein